jgi:hypothetical protein
VLAIQHPSQIESDYSSPIGISFHRRYRSKTLAFQNTLTQSFVDKTETSSAPGECFAGEYWAKDAAGTFVKRPYCFPFISTGESNFTLRKENGYSVAFNATSGSNVPANLNERAEKILNHPTFGYGK